MGVWVVIPDSKPTAWWLLCTEKLAQTTALPAAGGGVTSGSS